MQRDHPIVYFPWLARLRDRTGKHKLRILMHPVFLGVLLLKVAAAFWFTGDALYGQYFPAITSFVHHVQALFPAPWLHLMIMRILVLLADIGILVVLSRWLQHKEDSLVTWYWCSPVLFYMSYVIGSLDVIPIAFLFFFLLLLFKEYYYRAFLVLGCAIAVKTGLLILIPFAIIYLYRDYLPLRAITQLACVAIAIPFFVLLLHAIGPSGVFPAIFGQGFANAFSLSIPFGEHLTFYLLPALYVVLLLRSCLFQRLYRDNFLMFLGFALGLVILVVVPEAGWYFWIFPFLIYFYGKQGSGTILFVALSIFYFFHFLIQPGSPFYSSLATSLSAGQLQVLQNTAFSLLESVLFVNIIWLYRSGITASERLKIKYQPYLIGIAGDSAAGKSLLTTLLTQVFGVPNTLAIAGDDLHKWERGDEHWSEMTHLNPEANKIHAELETALALKRGRATVRRLYDHATGKFTKPDSIKPKKIIIFEGLHTLYINRMRELLDLKIFLSPDERLRRQWKTERDTKERGHSRKHVEEELRIREKDAELYIKQQKDNADIVVTLKQHEEAIEKGTDASIAVVFACDTSMFMDPLVEQFAALKTIRVTRTYEGNRQRIEIRGSIAAATVDTIASTLIPELWEVRRGDPEWVRDHNGVLQLVLTYVIFSTIKKDETAPSP